MSNAAASNMRCMVCETFSPLVSMSSRSWCPRCEMEFGRVMKYLEAAASVARHVAKRGK